MLKRDWTLLVIAAAKGEKVSPVQLQKALFLLSDKLSNEQRQTKSFYKFEPYDYGPFCADVYSDAEALAASDLVCIACENFSFRQYSVTPKGEAGAAKLRKELDGPVRIYLDAIVEWVRSQPFAELVQAIYKMYPAMKANSIFQEPE